MDTMHKMLNELCKYGLTEIQAKVYCVLTRLGKTSSTSIAKKLRIHRSEVYRVLRELQEKGIITEHMGRPTLFKSASSEEALKILLQEQLKKTEHLKRNLPKLVDWLDSQKARPSVLLIDDDESIRKTTAGTLKMSGFNVDTASDGSEALKKSRLRHYNLALVDIRLPDIEGTKLLKMLKTENREIKEIIITGYPSVENAIEAINEGADAYVMKPFKLQELLATVKEKLVE